MTETAPTLMRPREMYIAGVASGFARHLGWRDWQGRALFAGLALVGGSGILLYLWLWAFAPLERAEARDAPVRRAVPVAGILSGLAAITGIVAVWLANTERSPYLFAGLTALLAGGAVAWAVAFDRAGPRSVRYHVTVRVLGALVLLAVGLLLLFSRDGRPDAFAAVWGVALIVAGGVVVALPTIVKLWTELLAERSSRAREEQRAEIAAHLHDSVLQTLAIIQNRAGASSEVARLARAQERELRDWLYAGDAPVVDDVATALREIAAELELAHPVRFDVVATGDTSGIDAPALIAATREAMLNAARHAGGDVSVYVELGERLEVWVRDRGPGIELETLPADRFGVRESVLGRMTRAGGSAVVTPGADGTGTQVHLSLPLERRGNA